MAMITPVILDELFEVNNKREVISFDNDVLIIDNWYKNYEDIYNFLSHTYAPRWKYVPESRNFIDYYDCRLLIINQQSSLPYMERMRNIFKSLFKEYYKDYSHFVYDSRSLEFNIYKNIKRDVSNNLQHFPHRDTKYNVIVYLDKVCSGGTSIYDIEHIEDTEHFNILFDASNISKSIIPAIPNRCVIFHGNNYHGGYIEDHNKYVEDWRINQTLFINGSR